MSQSWAPKVSCQAVVPMGQRGSHRHTGPPYWFFYIHEAKMEGETQVCRLTKSLVLVTSSSIRFQFLQGRHFTAQAPGWDEGTEQPPAPPSLYSVTLPLGSELTSHLWLQNVNGVPFCWVFASSCFVSLCKVPLTCKFSLAID